MPTPAPRPMQCPLKNDWLAWSTDKRSDRLFMICPACKVRGSHVATLAVPR